MGPDVQVVADAREVIANPDIEIVVELIGGYGVARTLVLEAIAAGKHVVTANKALLAVHGTEIFEAAQKKGVMVAFEAAVAGGIPIIKALREGLSILVRSLYPIVPHIGHALWQALELGRGFEGREIIDAPLPVVDEAALVKSELELMLQVNGKLRGSIRVPADADKAAIEQVAAASPEVARIGEGKTPKRIIVVPGRLVNVVL